jgi:hypothetical protein
MAVCFEVHRILEKGTYKTRTKTQKCRQFASLVNFPLAVPICRCP